jgi:PAS domain S-box-containing protein
MKSQAPQGDRASPAKQVTALPPVLAVNNEWYRDLVEHSHDLLCIHDLQGFLLSINPAPARILGYTVDEMMQIPLREHVPPEFRSQFDAYLIEVREKGKADGFLAVMTRSGDRRIWQYHNTLRTEGVSTPVVRGMAHDITEQKNAEKAVRASETHFRLLFDQASDGIFVSDTEGRYLDVNPAGAEMLGYTREEILRLTIADVIARSETSRIPIETARMDGGAVTRVEWQLQRKDGSVFPGEVVGRRLPDGRLQGILRDITERQHAEDSLRRSEERLRVAMKCSGVFVCNQDRDLRYAWHQNPVLFWKDQNILGKTDAEVLGNEAAASLIEIKNCVLESGVGTRMELPIRYQDKQHYFDLIIEPLADARGLVAGLTCAAIDVTSLRNDHALIKVNCASIPSGLLESELFGHERGPSPAPSPEKSGDSNWRTKGRCSWTKSERFLSKYSRSCFGFCRTRSSRG